MWVHSHLGGIFFREKDSSFIKHLLRGLRGPEEMPGSLVLPVEVNLSQVGMHLCGLALGCKPFDLWLGHAP